MAVTDLAPPKAELGEMTPAELVNLIRAECSRPGMSRACGLDDFDELAARFLDTASVAAADIDALAH